MARPNSSKSFVARVRSEVLRTKGVGFPPRLAAPFGVLHTVATSGGQAMFSDPAPNICFKKDFVLALSRASRPRRRGPD